MSILLNRFIITIVFISLFFLFRLTSHAANSPYSVDMNSYSDKSYYLTVGFEPIILLLPERKVSNISITDISIMPCISPTFGVLFFKYFGVQLSYAGCTNLLQYAHTFKAQAIVMKKMPVNDWGFRPYLAFGPKYIYYHTSDDGYGDPYSANGFGVALSAGLRFYYHRFLIGLEVNLDTLSFDTSYNKNNSLSFATNASLQFGINF